jgi:hypothetical protein
VLLPGPKALGREVSALGREVSALGREVSALGREVQPGVRPDVRDCRGSAHGSWLGGFSKVCSGLLSLISGF